ncbi:MAG: hypothetical protein ACI3YD_07295 [Alloprevotella sp.]
MKCKVMMLLAAACVATAMQAQTASELAKQQMEQNSVYRKMLDAKPTKSAKKQAKEFKKEGWRVTAGAKSLEQQITESQIYGEALTVDENGATIKRYMIQAGMQTAGSYNAGFAAARTAAMVELAGMLRTRIVAAMQQKLDNSQSQEITAVTIDKFNQRSKAIVDAELTRSILLLAMYRNTSNNLYEVQVRLAFDKKELAARLKRQMQQQLEAEGDELEELVDEVLGEIY